MGIHIHIIIYVSGYDGYNGYSWIYMGIITFIHEYLLYSIISKDSYLRHLPFLILGMISFPHLKMLRWGWFMTIWHWFYHTVAAAGAIDVASLSSYTYISTHTHTYIYIYMYVCMYVCMYFYNFLYACTARKQRRYWYVNIFRYMYNQKYM